MANYLLDTHHAAVLVTLAHPLRQRVLLRLQAGDTFAITVPVVAETLYGIGLLPRATQNLAEWAKASAQPRMLHPMKPMRRTPPRLQRSLRRQGWRLETVDAFIAVVALRYNLVLLTSDNDFAPVPNLTRKTGAFRERRVSRRQRWSRPENGRGASARRRGDRHQ